LKGTIEATLWDFTEATKRDEALVFLKEMLGTYTKFE